MVYTFSVVRQRAPSPLYVSPFAPILFFFKSPSVVCEMMRMEIKERLAQFNGQVSLMDIMTYLYF